MKTDKSIKLILKKWFKKRISLYRIKCILEEINKIYFYSMFRVVERENWVFFELKLSKPLCLKEFDKIGGSLRVYSENKKNIIVKSTSDSRPTILWLYMEVKLRKIFEQKYTDSNIIDFIKERKKLYASIYSGVYNDSQLSCLNLIPKKFQKLFDLNINYKILL